MRNARGQMDINRIPELDQLINEKLEQIADCIGRERGMAKFSTLPDQQQDTLLDDAFDLANEWKQKDLPATATERERLLQQHYDLTQEMKAIHVEVDRLSKQFYNDT